MTEYIQIPVSCALVHDGQGKILLQQRADSSIPDADGKWEFPGGRVEFGENPTVTVVRECKEEIGCDVQVERLLPLIVSNVWSHYRDKQAQALVMCYVVTITNGQPQVCDPKVTQVKWFSKEEALQADILPGIREFIDLL